MRMTAWHPVIPPPTGKIYEGLTHLSITYRVLYNLANAYYHSLPGSLHFVDEELVLSCSDRW
jgi:hypothetical protein